jgi:uncharacterized protein YaiL (DUF2058 family)
MATVASHIQIDLSDKFREMVAEAIESFKRLHTEMTDSMKAMIAEEVKRQLEGEQTMTEHQKSHEPTIGYTAEIQQLREELHMLKSGLQAMIAAEVKRHLDEHLPHEIAKHAGAGHKPGMETK